VGQLRIRRIDQYVTRARVGCNNPHVVPSIRECFRIQSETFFWLHRHKLAIGTRRLTPARLPLTDVGLNGR
jgi:hypothetical protein